MKPKNRYACATHCGLLAAAGIGIALVVMFFRFGMHRPDLPRAHKTAIPPPAEKNRFTRTVIEDFQLNGQPDATAFPLITLGACRVVKPQLGGFRLGVGDILEFEQLALNLPLDESAAQPKAQGTINALLSQSLDLSAFRRMAHEAGPVSSTKVNGLRISLVHGTNQFHLITASTARVIGRSNILLRECAFLDCDLRTVHADKVRLTEDHGWRITPDGGSPVDIEAVVEAVRRQVAGEP